MSRRLVFCHFRRVCIRSFSFSFQLDLLQLFYDTPSSPSSSSPAPELKSRLRSFVASRSDPVLKVAFWTSSLHLVFQACLILPEQSCALHRCIDALFSPSSAIVQHELTAPTFSPPPLSLFFALCFSFSSSSSRRPGSLIRSSPLERSYKENLLLSLPLWGSVRLPSLLAIQPKPPSPIASLQARHHPPFLSRPDGFLPLQLDPQPRGPSSSY